MTRIPLLDHLSLLCLGAALVLLSPLAQAAPMTTAEQIQIYACRATSSLLMMRGEGFQEAHRSRLEDDIASLQQAVRSSDPALIELSDKLVTQLRLGVSYGPRDEDTPWRFLEDMSRSLRDLLIAARSQPGATPEGELPIQVEYLAVQYLSRAYIGTFEIAREHPDNYVGQDETKLVPTIDAGLQAMDAQHNPGASKLQTRWSFLRAALMDMNSRSNALNSVSGRAFAPTTVDRHARLLSDQWMTLDTVARAQ